MKIEEEQVLKMVTKKEPNKPTPSASKKKCRRAVLPRKMDCNLHVNGKIMKETRK